MAHLWMTNNLVNQQYGVDFTMVTGTEQTQFPLTNILNKSTTKVSRLTVSGGIAEFYVDLKQSSNIDIFSIVGSSVDGLGFTACSIFGSTTTDFSGSTEILVDLDSDHNFGFKEFTEVSYRYWKIKVTAGSYAEISNFYIGAKTELTNNFINANTFTKLDNTMKRVVTNQYGQQFIRFYNRQLTLSGTIINLKETDKNILEEIHAELGSYVPFFFILDSEGGIGTSSQFKYSGYFYYAVDPTLSARQGVLWSVPLQYIGVG